VGNPAIPITCGLRNPGPSVSKSAMSSRCLSAAGTTGSCIRPAMRRLGGPHATLVRWRLPRIYGHNANQGSFRHLGGEPKLTNLRGDRRAVATLVVMLGGQGKSGSKLPSVTIGLNTYRRSQTATDGGRPVARNASSPDLSISQKGALASSAWSAKFCVVIRNGNAAN